MSVQLALMQDLLPAGFDYGKIYLVEFDSASLWYETSLMMAAEAVKSGVKCEYHVLQHVPDETLNLLQGLGLHTEELISQGRLRLIDYYTPATKLGKGKDVADTSTWISRDAFSLEKWGEDTRKLILSGVPESDKRWLHLDDNMSVLLQLFDENALVDYYRTTMVPWTRARELILFCSVVTGIASDNFYRKFEASADGIIDFSCRDEGGEVKDYVRIRSVRGEEHKSGWRLLRLEDGKVSFGEGRGSGRVGFKEKLSGPVFDFLVEEFIADLMRRNLHSDKSGWRTLSEVSKGTGISSTLLYTQHAASGPVFRELRGRGLVETKQFPGERGRGGEVTRIRIAYDKEPVRMLVNERVRNSD